MSGFHRVEGSFVFTTFGGSFCPSTVEESVNTLKVFFLVSRVSCRHKQQQKKLILIKDNNRLERGTLTEIISCECLVSPIMINESLISFGIFISEN
jgi:hypothetical protein